jgi:hypothetical protein
VINHLREWVTFSVVLVSLTTCATAANPIPFIGQPLKPANAAPGSSSLTLVVRGTGFTRTSVVQWNGVGLSTRYVSARKLTANVASSFVAAPGFATINIRNTAPGGGTSNPAFFEVTEATPSAVVFETRVQTPGPTYSAATGDFNGDGNLDIATSTGSTISILLGKGDGAFNVTTFSTTATFVGYLVAGDFNGDGKVDLAFPDPANNRMHVLLGHGDGTFTEASTPHVGGHPVWAAVADFNGDGRLDLAVLNQSTRTVSLLLGKGDGSFSKGAILHVGAHPSSIVAGDFNDDGRLDLAIANSGSNTLSIFLGHGDGTFAAATSLPTGSTPYQVVVSDFNGDGKVDLAVSNACGNASSCSAHAYGSVSTFLGKGDGTFVLASATETNYHNTQGLIAADFTGDGKVDLAVVNSTEPNSEILVGNGNGSFHGQYEIYATTGPYPQNAVAGDFNNDGRLDYAVNTGSGGFVGNFLSVILQSPIGFYPDILKFGPQTVGTTSAPKTVVVANIGIAPIHIVNAGVTLAFNSTNDCPSTLQVGATCMLNVTFTPLFKGLSGGVAYVKDDALGIMQQSYLQGTGK